MIKNNQGQSARSFFYMLYDQKKTCLVKLSFTLYVYHTFSNLECSTTCEPGVMTRRVECQRTDAAGLTSTVSDAACAYRPNKPLSEVSCNGKSSCAPGLTACLFFTFSVLLCY